MQVKHRGVKNFLTSVKVGKKFLRHFCADFYRLLSSLQTFIEFTDLYRLLLSFLLLFKFIEFTDFYHYAPKFMSFLY